VRHLSAAQLLDLVEGTADSRSQSHLESCSDCRAQLDDARAAAALVRGVDLPEPSPLFWDHLSARVHAAVAAERAHGPSSRAPWTGWGVAAALGAAALVVAVGLTIAPGTGPTPPLSSVSRAKIDASAGAVDAALTDDASLSFVADLASDLDWDAAAEAGLTTPPGAVEGVLPTLSQAETAELQRLLTEALARRPARGGV
jgi:predicted anti-sigma-YlaC factor YlaD